MSKATARQSSLKRPRSSSSSTPSDTPLHKRPRASSVLGASPLIRSIRAPVGIGNQTAHKPPANTTSRPQRPQRPQRPRPPPPPPEQDARLSSQSPESDHERHERSAVSSTSPEDAAKFEELIREGFNYHEALLFHRIMKRGYEPLMPAHWQVDFSTLPDVLFSAAGGQPPIKAMTLDGTFNATTAFQALLGLGAMVRGRLEGGQEVELKILLGLRRYIQWSIDDAMLAGWEIQPFIAIASSEGSPQRCEERMNRKLQSLAAALRAEEVAQATQGPPPEPQLSSTVYGFAIAGCLAALITLGPCIEPYSPRTLLVLDFSDQNGDFWNAVTISLLVMAARTDEIQREEFCKARNIKRPVHTSAWWWGRRPRGAKSRDSESDEDA